MDSAAESAVQFGIVLTRAPYPASQVPLPASLPLGVSIAARFTIQAPAGGGAMGAVYRACDQHTGQTVALKILHADRSSPLEHERFFREIRILAGLHHPGIVSYVAHGVSETGRPYLAMEWLDGEDLAQRLRTRPLELSDTLTLIQRLAEALATAHQRSIVHRELLLL